MGRVLILINSSGGLYDFRNEFVQALLEKNEVYVSVPDDVKTKELAEEGCRIITTPINRRGLNPLEDLKLYRTYRRLMRELKPDLVATYTIKPNIYGGLAAAGQKIPYIATITGLGGAFDRTGLLLRLIVAMYRAGLKN
ncbi:MAG: glycosyltransferase, partial [Muribaculaceae bacterium]|nr:glycosyltransferase [Muribaculaceae bacterium]